MLLLQILQSPDGNTEPVLLSEVSARPPYHVRSTQYRSPYWPDFQNTPAMLPAHPQAAPATASFHVLSNTFIPASFFISCTLKVFLTLVIVGDFTHHTRISSIHIRNLSASGKKIISQNQTRKISSAYISWIYPYFPQTSITSCIFMVKSFILIFAINLLIFSINKATLFFRDCFHLSTIHFNFGFYHRIIKN